MLTAEDITIKLTHLAFDHPDEMNVTGMYTGFSCIRPPQATDNRSFWDQELLFEVVPLSPDKPVSVSCIA